MTIEAGNEQRGLGEKEALLQLAAAEC